MLESIVAGLSGRAAGVNFLVAGGMSNAAMLAVGATLP
jgi:hypothetical protein